MVITIATVFIVTSIPSCTHNAVMLAIPGFEHGGQYAKLYRVGGMLFVGFNAISSGANMIIYYKMSHKFRDAMLVVLRRKSVGTGTTVRGKCAKDV